MRGQPITGLTPAVCPWYPSIQRSTERRRGVKVRSWINDLVLWNQRPKHFGSTNYLPEPSSILILRGGCPRRTWLTQSSSNPLSWLAATYCEDGKSGWDWWNKRTSWTAFSNLSGNKHYFQWRTFTQKAVDLEKDYGTLLSLRYQVGCNWLI